MYDYELMNNESRSDCSASALFTGPRLNQFWAAIRHPIQSPLSSISSCIRCLFINVTDSQSPFMRPLKGSWLSDLGHALIHLTSFGFQGAYLTRSQLIIIGKMNIEDSSNFKLKGNNGIILNIFSYH